MDEEGQDGKSSQKLFCCFGFTRRILSEHFKSFLCRLIQGIIGSPPRLIVYNPNKNDICTNPKLVNRFFVVECFGKIPLLNMIEDVILDSMQFPYRFGGWIC